MAAKCQSREAQATTQQLAGTRLPGGGELGRAARADVDGWAGGGGGGGFVGRGGGRVAAHTAGRIALTHTAMATTLPAARGSSSASSSSAVVAAVWAAEAVEETSVFPGSVTSPFFSTSSREAQSRSLTRGAVSERCVATLRPASQSSPKSPFCHTR